LRFLKLPKGGGRGRVFDSGFPSKRKTWNWRFSDSELFNQKPGSTVINRIKYPPNIGQLIRVISTVVEITLGGGVNKKYSGDLTTQDVPSGSAAMG
jgi:hypothetical protein